MVQRDDLSQYSKKMRTMEFLSILAFVALFSAISFQITTPQLNEILFPLLAALILSDMVSGFVHWFADTWGSASWPLLGPTLIRSFREHHVDQESITRHDFIETNGASSFVVLPVLASGWFIESTVGKVFILNFSLFIFLTNQIHKWAHQKQNAPVISLFQKFNLILSPDKHKLHHSGEHKLNYAITTGWSNVLFDRLKIFRVSERIIRFLTGIQPREEDSVLIRKFRHE